MKRIFEHLKYGITCLPFVFLMLIVFGTPSIPCWIDWYYGYHAFNPSVIEYIIEYILSFIFQLFILSEIDDHSDGIIDDFFQIFFKMNILLWNKLGYFVEIEYSYNEINDWCNKNCSHWATDYEVVGKGVFFLNKDDATLFKLTWG